MGTESSGPGGRRGPDFVWLQTGDLADAHLLSKVVGGNRQFLSPIQFQPQENARKGVNRVPVPLP